MRRIIPTPRFVAALVMVGLGALTLPAQAEDTSDLAKLFAPPVNSEELGWLEGAWGVVDPTEPTDAACGTHDGKAYISFDTSDAYRPDIDAQPEPANADGDRSVGWSVIQEDDNTPGFLNVTPRDWEDAYLKFRPLGEESDNMEIRMWEFSSADTAWFETRTFYLEKCDG